MVKLNVNGNDYKVEVPDDVQLLWVLRDYLKLSGTKYACGIGECGSCTVHINGKAERSCTLTAGEVKGKKIVTIEGLPEDHPVKRAWIEEQVATIPQLDRRLVTDHTVLGYFSERYGFEQAGAVFPGYSSLAEPSARELAGLQDAIAEQGVKAVFVGTTVNPDLASRVAEDTGARLVFLYTGALSEPSGPAGDYISFMKYNVGAIVDALR